MTWNGLSIDALGFFAEPLNERRAIGDFTTGFGQWLTLLSGHNDRKVLLVGHHEIKPFAQYF